MKLHGVIPPVTTPFGPDGEVALDKLRSNISRYNKTKLSGYLVIGSTGESVLLRQDETERVLGAVREAAAPDKLLIAGTGTDSTAETIARTNRAAGLGYQVALVKTPYYYKPMMTPEVECEHFLRVADASKIPILIYSVPQFTGVTVEAPLAAKLSQHPNIIGIKESSGVIQRITEIIAATPEKFQTLVGSAQTFFASLAVGAVGGILAASCILPDLCVELYEAAHAGELDRGRQLQHRLLKPAIAVTNRYGIPGLKHAMDLLGYYGGPPRRPLLPLDETGKREIENILAGITQPT
ncbi:MAG: dihydrodipicolinate synthase family protein [Acidobacteria bacterium]|nr:dihydrodipicolinate synthase family protein [Acidobacteriota bacterium]